MRCAPSGTTYRSYVQKGTKAPGSAVLFEFSGGRDRIESLPGLTESGSMRQLMLPQEFFDSAGDFFPMRFERKMARIQ